MTAESLAWRRGFPGRALRRFSWVAGTGGALTGGSWLLFGSEPDRLPSGGVNPIALVPVGTTALVLMIAILFLLPVFRGPLLVADHYALKVRPGPFRTLLLPWAEIAEVAGVTVRGDPLLLVRGNRARGGLGRLGDRPRWCDQGVLRSGGSLTEGFDLAVRMDEFTGAPTDQLAALAAWIPRQVRITDALD